MSSSWTGTCCRKARDIRPLDRRGVEVIEVIHHLDRMAEREAPLDKVRANEAGSARYEDFHAVAGAGQRNGGSPLTASCKFAGMPSLEERSL